MILRRQQAMARRWNARMFEIVEENIEAAFDAALLSAKSEAVHLALAVEMDFLQTQTQRLLSQTQEAMALMMQASTEAFEICSAMIAMPDTTADL